MEQEKFEKIINLAGRKAKDKIYDFVKDIYGEEELEKFKSLEDVLIIPTYRGDIAMEKCLPEELRDKDEVLDEIDDCISESIGESEACVITAETLYEELENIETKEFNPKEYKTFITYSEEKLKKQYESFKKEGSEEWADKAILNYSRKVFLHELCHVNSTYYRYDNGQVLEQSGFRGSYFFPDDVNNLYEEDYNELVTESLAQIVRYHKEGESVEDSVYKFVEKGRDGWDDASKPTGVMAISTFVLFPEEMTKWAMFFAYEDEHKNLLQEKLQEIYNTDELDRLKNVYGKLHDYCMNPNVKLSDKQKEMLEMLGVSIPHDIEKVAEKYEDDEEER